MKRTIVVAAFSTLLAACGVSAETTEQPDTGTAAASESATTVAATATTTSTTVALPTAADLEPGWIGAQLLQSDVPKVLVQQWEAAENRSWCSALYPADATSLGPGGVIRPANFGGGWAVAWDLPDGPGRLPSGEYCRDCGRGRERPWPRRRPWRIAIPTGRKPTLE